MITAIASAGSGAEKILRNMDFSLMSNSWMPGDEHDAKEPSSDVAVGTKLSRNLSRKLRARNMHESAHRLRECGWPDPGQSTKAQTGKGATMVVPTSATNAQRFSGLRSMTVAGNLC